jgi:2-polyprenyl-6-methoxyphenol hydroxylase-like FAD-dependent oxidoreductase
VLDILERAGGITVRYHVPYDELRSPHVAESARRDVSAAVPGGRGALCASHPASCLALSEAAARAGAEVVRGISDVRVSACAAPSVSFGIDGPPHTFQAALVIGSDGRTSSVRAQAGIPLHKARASHLICGLLVEGDIGWPQDSYSVGTEDDVMFFVFPQSEGRLRLYCCTALDQRSRFAGADGPRHFLEAFSRLSCLPYAGAISQTKAIGPCATLGGEDSWTDPPFNPGVALIGDAAGYNDPIIGQGLSLAMRDVRVLSEILLAGEDWSPARLQSYADERRERMRRMRFTATLVAALRSEFGPEARERRRRFGMRLQQGDDPELKFALAATSAGPDGMPAFAFEESMRAKVLL